MSAVKIAGLTLKSEPKVETNLTTVAPETVAEILDRAQVEEVEAEESTDISLEIKHIIKRAEALPSTDNNIRVIAKLKGALELLNS